MIYLVDLVDLSIQTQISSYFVTRCDWYGIALIPDQDSEEIVYGDHGECVFDRR